jgi:myosin heavy subunit
MSMPIRTVCELSAGGFEIHLTVFQEGTHARELSSASAPLPDTTKYTPHVLRSASEPQQTEPDLAQPPLPYQRLARDKQILEQRISHVQLVLDQVRLDLLQVTKEKHALKQQVHRQDEENQRVKDQLRDAKRQYESIQSELEAYTQVKEDLLSANKEKNCLKDDLEDTKRKLETTTSELRDTKTRSQELGAKHKKLDKSFRDSRHENHSLEIRLADAKSQIITLTEEKNKAEEHMKKYRAFSQAIYKEIKPEQDKNRAYEAEITQIKSLLELKTSTLQETQVQLASLEKEKETWRGRMDTMIHKVFASERRIRMLHHAARTLEPQNMGDSSGHQIRRGKNTKPNTSFSAEIVDTVSTLNKAILDAASNFTPLFFSPDSQTWSGNVERAKVVFGEWVTSRMRKEGWNRPWMLQSIIQMFLVDWCYAIIEAWYPKQQSFAELFLTALASQKSSFRGPFSF